MGIIPKESNQKKFDENPGPADYNLPQMIPLVANYNTKK